MSGAARTIALVGLRCSGKSSVGRALAERLALPFVDLDAELARLARERHGGAERPAGAWLAELGEPAFRDLETAALERVLARPAPCVLATGGGVVERAANRSLLAACTCVWLQVPAAELARRMEADPTPRPGLLGPDPTAEIEELERRRAPLYAVLEPLAVDACAPAADVAARIERSLAL